MSNPIATTSPRKSLLLIFCVFIIANILSLISMVQLKLLGTSTAISERVNNLPQQQQQQPTAPSRVVKQRNWSENNFQQRIQNVQITKKSLSKRTWWENFVEPLSLVYPSLSKDYPWCIPEPFPSPRILQSNTTVAQGLLYVKLYKTSSSTCQGINEQIAHQVAERLQYNVPACIHYNRHEFTLNHGHGKRSLDETSLLWSFVRHPVKRDVSEYFHFYVTRNGYSGSNIKAMIEKIRNTMKSSQTYYMIPYPYIKRNFKKLKLDKRDDAQQAIQIMDQYIFHYYDFIGITERFDESLAVMVVLWNLDITDVIVLSAKQAHKDNVWDVREGYTYCEKLTPSFVLPKVEEFFKTKHMHQNFDYLLYHVANQSLTKTIKHIGVEKIATITKQIKYLRNLAQEQCQQHAYYPCSNTGELQWDLAKESCYEEDSGCGHKCVMEILGPYMNQQKEIPIITEEGKNDNKNVTFPTTTNQRRHRRFSRKRMYSNQK